MPATCTINAADLYPEPLNGTREEAIKALLKEGLREIERGKMNKKATSATGLQLADKFVSLLDVVRLVKCPPLSPRQLRIVQLYFRDDRTNQEIADMLGLSRDTVGREKRAAVQTMVDIIWPYPESAA